jgi:hypothetical protein
MTVSRVTVTTHGALFTGQATSDMRKLLDGVKQEVAMAGEQLVKRELGQRMKNPTGHYTGQIHVEKLGSFNDQLITDGGVIYGPWLETGKYSPPRRFKGYQAWRRTRQKLRKWWVPVAQRRVDQLVAKWNS